MERITRTSRNVSCIALSLVFQHLAAGAENLLANGDFEQEKLGEIPSRWAKMGWGPSRISSIDAGRERAGKRVAKIISNGVSWHFIGQNVEVKRGRTYRLKWSGRTDGKVGGVVEVRGYRPGRTSPWGAKNARVLVRKSFTGDEWRSYSLEFTAPVEKDAKAVVLVLLGTSAWKPEGTWVLYDDVILEAIDNGNTAATKRADEFEPGANLIVNGGFEFGVHGWILRTLQAVRKDALRVDRTAPFAGRGCLVVAGDATGGFDEPIGGTSLVSNWSRVEPGGVYYLSLALKGSRRGQKAWFRLYHSRVGDPLGFQMTKKRVTLTPEWQTFTLKQAVPEHIPLRKVVVEIFVERGRFWLDAVRLGRNGPVDDRAIADESAGVRVDLGRFPPIYDYRKPAQFSLEAWNTSETPRRLAIEYRIEDLRENTLKKGRLEADLDGGESKSITVPVDTSRRGRFALVSRVLGEGGRLIRERRTPFLVLKPIRPNPKSPIGINVCGAPYRGQFLEDIHQTLGRYGYSWNRLWFAWKFAELKEHGEEGGPFDWREFDRQVASARRNGMSILGCLTVSWEPRQTMTWRKRRYYGPDSDYTNRDFGRWLRFVRATVSRYRDQVDAWEIQNEPNLYPPERLRWYNALVQATYPVVKAEAPDAPVSACSPGDSGQRKVWNSHLYVEDFLKMGGVKYCDRIGLHPYTGTGSPIWGDLQSTLDTLRKWAREAGGRQDVVMTEAGNYTSIGGYYKDGNDLAQASRQAQVWLIAWANRTQHVQHAASPVLNSRRSCFDPILIPNATFCAANVLAEFFNRADYESCKWLKLPDKLHGVYGLGFTSGREQVWALWCEGMPETRRLVVPVSPGRVSAVDILGNPVRIERHQDKPLVTITSLLTYVKLAGLSAREASRALAETLELPDVGTDLAATVGTVQAGEVHAVGYTPPPAGPFKPDRDGFIRDWLVMGPFANPGQRGHSAGFDYDFLKPIGGEALVRLRPGMSVFYEFPAGRREWTPKPPRREVKAVGLHSNTPAIDLKKSMSPATYVVAYAYCHVTVPKSIEAHVRLGSDDGIRVWVNGAEVLKRRVYRGAAPDQDSAAVHLRKGENRVMVKVDTDLGGWEFCLRFVDAGGNPLPGLSVSW